jgi:hypothetical protein
VEVKVKLRRIRAERVSFDSSRKIREDDGSLVVPAVLTRESILPFDAGFGYRPAAELELAAWTLEGAWVVANNHIATVFVTDRADIRGKVENVRFDGKINGVVGDIRFLKSCRDQTFLDGVRSGSLRDVSVAYYSEEDFSPGKFGDEVYDFVQRNFMFGHVAAGVPEGRCPNPYCGMNADALIVAPQGDSEETADYIHVTLRDPALFVEDHFRIVEFDAKLGVKAVVGKLKSDSKGAAVVQKYIFTKAKGWTLKKAEDWAKQHKDSVLPGVPKSSGVSSQGDKVPDGEVERLDPFEVLEDSRRLLRSR